MTQTVSKKLTKNDLGLTGGHQGGICVPFKVVRMDFFPALDASEYNPRSVIDFDFRGGCIRCTYIYYNSRLHGSGTRNEYRLTGMSRFFRENLCQEGDLVEFCLNDGKYSIDIKHQNQEDEKDVFDPDRPLIIHSDWAYKRG